MITDVLSVGGKTGKSLMISFLTSRRLRINMVLLLDCMEKQLDLYPGIQEIGLSMLRLATMEYGRNIKEKALERNSLRRLYAELKNMMG